jgi:glycosyltransferase involved in cell wall biosynthesis
VTTDDAGGPNEFVTNGVNGWVTPPDAKALAEAIARLDADRPKSARMGDEGYDLARGITWSGVIDRLTSA